MADLPAMPLWTKMKITYISRQWKDRSGGDHFASVDGSSIDPVKADEMFRALGWPGHPGGFWNYFKRDVAAVVEFLIFGVR